MLVHIFYSIRTNKKCNKHEENHSNHTDNILHGHNEPILHCCDTNLLATPRGSNFKSRELLQMSYAYAKMNESCYKYVYV